MQCYKLSPKSEEINPGCETTCMHQHARTIKPGSISVGLFVQLYKVNT